MSLKPNRARELREILLNSLERMKTRDWEDCLCGSHKLLPPEGEVRGQQREAENLELSCEDSGRAL